MHCTQSQAEVTTWVGDICMRHETCRQQGQLHTCRGFVETVLEMYLEGISLSEIEAMMAIARLESGGQLVGPLQQEVMLSWSAMVFLTLQAIGLPLRPSGVSPLWHFALEGLQMTSATMQLSVYNAGSPARSPQFESDCSITKSSETERSTSRGSSG